MQPAVRPTRPAPSSSVTIADRMRTLTRSWRPRSRRRSFRVLLTQDYCPTPTLCWSVAQDADAVGGIMLTSSHNPAEYLGVKLRMNDGGAAGKEFTDRVEAAFADAPPTRAVRSKRSTS